MTKRRIFVAAIFLLAAWVVSLLVPRIFSETTILGSQCLTNGKDEALQKIAIRQFSDLKLSGAFLIAKDAEILAQGACGSADPAVRAPITAQTKFNIGSLTKQFTGYLVFELVRDGRIRLSDAVSQYIPELAQTPSGKITIEQLVRMRSGLPYVLPTAKFLEVQLTKRIRTEEEMAQAFGAMKLEFMPGEKFKYSNLGYSLLGIVIGRVTHSSWANAIKAKIFEPFKMLSSSVEGETSDRPTNLAVGLLPLSLLSRTFFFALPHWNYSMIRGAGGIVTTVDDLHTWNEAIEKRAQSDPEFLKSYFPSGEPGDENYNYGWIYSESKIAGRSIHIINHGGEDPGYCSQNILIPELQSEIILTTNSDYCVFKDGAYSSFTRAINEYLSQMEPLTRDEDLDRGQRLKDLALRKNGAIEFRLKKDRKSR